MKKFFKFMLMAAVTATVAASCSKDPVEPPHGGEGGITDYPYPMESPAGPDGVSLKVSDISESDFMIDLKMGLEIEGFRIDVMPLAAYYNQLMEYRKSYPDATESEFQISFLYANGGNSGYTFVESTELYWGASQYSQAEMIHGIDYIILTGGCEMADGSGPLALNTLKVSLTEEPVIGNPTANIKVEALFRGFVYEFTKNADCFAFYQLALPTDHFDEFLDVCTKLEPELGTTLARDLARDIICCWTLEPHTEDLKDQIDFGYAAEEGLTCTFLSVGLDMNGTPSKEFIRLDEKLPKAPDSGDVKYEFKTNFVCAAGINLTWDIDYETTDAVFCRPCDPSTLKQLEAMPEMDLKMLLANEGYGHNQLNDDQQFYWGLIPNTDYTMLTIGRDKAYKLKEKVRHYPFKTLPLIMDQPDKSTAQVTVEADGPNGIGKDVYKALYHFPEGTVVYYERIMQAGYRHQGVGDDLTAPENRDRVVPYLLSIEGGNASANFYSGNTCNWAGLIPGEHYFHFVVGEDQNGYIGNLYCYEFTTKANTGGPNPEVKISHAMKVEADTYNWAVTFTCNADVSKVRYCIITDETDSDMSLDARKNIWQDMLLGAHGMEGITTARLSARVTEYSSLVAVAIAFGVKADGSPVQKPLEYLIFEPGMIQSSVMAPAPLRVPATNHTDIYRERSL